MKPSLRTWRKAFGVLMAVLAVEAPAAEHMTRLELFQQAHRRSDDLARYVYLLTILPQLGPVARNPALQLLAFTENELGLYTEALREFPLRMRLPPTLELPSPAQWQAEDAVDAIAALAAHRQIVMVNEAHHDAHTRVLTLALLGRLRAEGFSYFAAEALDSRDQGLSKRGYPLLSSGTEYLHEPIYGELIREALKLGYTVVPYEAGAKTGTGQAREDAQARNLYLEVFAQNPKARLLVHSGYAHIDKKPARLGNLRPMAMQLQKLTGIAPLSIDQVDVRDDNPQNEIYAEQRARAESATQRAIGGIQTDSSRLLKAAPRSDFGPLQSNPYQRIIDAFRPTAPVVFRRRDGAYWSARPEVYDLNVVLPQGGNEPSDYRGGPLRLDARGRSFSVMPPAAGGERPHWLALRVQRVALPISADGCGGPLPCQVQAWYADESDTAVAADRFVFLMAKQRSALYLRPGRYRVRYTSTGDSTVTETVREITAGK